MKNGKFSKKFVLRLWKRSRFAMFYNLILLFFLFLLFIYKPTFIDFITNKIYDTLLVPNCNEETSGIPVIIDIDEKSLKEFGQWPWPRYRIAHLLDKLRLLGAVSIGLDILFSESDRSSINNIQKEFFNDFRIKFESHSLYHELGDNDKILAETLSKGPFILGYQFLFDDEIVTDHCFLHPLSISIIQENNISTQRNLITNAQSVSCNLKILSKSVSSSGFFNASFDRDGILRSVPLIIKHKGKIYPSLSLATFMEAYEINHIILKNYPGDTSHLYVGNKVIPLDEHGKMLIRFRGKSKKFKYISASDILSDKIDREQIKGKIVFIGTSAAGIEDFKSTPLDPFFPGVEIHATIVDNILKEDFLSRPEWVSGLELVLILITGLVCTLFFIGTGGGWSLLLFCISIVGLWKTSDLVFRINGIFISPLFPLITVVINFILLTLLKFSHEKCKVIQRSRELTLTQDATFESMYFLADARDPETGGHIKRTQHYMIELARYLKNHPGFSDILDDEYINALYKSTPLHDIGKVGISDKILFKPGRLTDEEFNEMKKHTLYGASIISSAEKKLGKSSFLHLAYEIAYTHHEKWDGSGYPRGLIGTQIPLSGRLMAVADVYDALISKRPYKPPFPHEKVVQIIIEGKGTHFAPDIVDVFLELQEKFYQISIEHKDVEEKQSSQIDSICQQEKKEFNLPLREEDFPLDA